MSALTVGDDVALRPWALLVLLPEAMRQDVWRQLAARLAVLDVEVVAADRKSVV